MAYSIKTDDVAENMFLGAFVRNYTNNKPL